MAKKISKRKKALLEKIDKNKLYSLAGSDSKSKRASICKV